MKITIKATKYDRLLKVKGIALKTVKEILREREVKKELI